MLQGKHCAVRMHDPAWPDRLGNNHKREGVGKPAPSLNLGCLRGFEPPTSSSTVRRSTLELQAPRDGILQSAQGSVKLAPP
jgi:hypothetical protein